MFLVDWALVLYAVYVPLIILLYIIELVAIFKQRRNAFNSSFYRVFTVLAVVNIAACVVGTFVFRLPLFPIVNKIFDGMTVVSGWLTLAYSGAFYLNCLSEFLGVFLAFNRFTTLYFPGLHDKFWRWALFIGTLLCFFISIAPITDLLDDENRFIEIVYERSNISWYYLDGALVYFNMFIVSVVSNTLSSLLYGACLIRLCLFSVSRNYTVERNFFLVGFLTMIFSLPYCAAMLYFHIVFALDEEDMDIDVITFVAYQLPWLTDLKYLASAPMLLITNASIRRAMAKIVYDFSAARITTRMFNLDWAFLVYAVYVPLLLGLYVLELLAIFQHRKKLFNSSFFRTFSVLTVVNITACLLGSFVFRLPLYPIVNGLYSAMLNNNGWLTAAYSGAYYLNCVSEFLGVFLAFNRFTTLYFPMLHEQFWRWALFVGVSFCFLISIAPVWYLVDDANMYVKVDDPRIPYKWYYLDAVSEIPEASIWFNMVIVTLVCNSISFLLYGACLVRLCLFSVTRNYTVERNFFLVGFLSMMFSLPYCAAMLFFYLNLPIVKDDLDVDLTVFVTFQLPWLTDLKYLTPAPMLLLTNKSIRTAIKMIFTIGEARKINSLSKNETGSNARVVQVTMIS